MLQILALSAAKKAPLPEKLACSLCKGVYPRSIYTGKPLIERRLHPLVGINKAFWDKGLQRLKPEERHCPYHKPRTHISTLELSDSVKWCKVLRLTCSHCHNCKSLHVLPPLQRRVSSRIRLKRRLIQPECYVVCMRPLTRILFIVISPNDHREAGCQDCHCDDCPRTMFPQYVHFGPWPPQAEAPHKKCVPIIDKFEYSSHGKLYIVEEGRNEAIPLFQTSAYRAKKWLKRGYIPWV